MKHTRVKAEQRRITTAIHRIVRAKKIFTKATSALKQTQKRLKGAKRAHIAAAKK